ncbi:hypothetical protein [Peptacetobacter sp.]|uniref:hypothetical protein n=1 Tax=Peptacetobacter sp. TaxID=2991975 RepID=UPI0026314073|nr:hypothetical protein [Peptacetobacter sp.]
MKNTKKKNIIVVILTIIITTIILIIGFFNISSSSDISFIKLSDRENQLASMVGENTFAVNISYPDNIKGKVISYEVWENGKITDKNSILYGDTDIINKEETLISIYDLSDDNKKCTLNISTDSIRTKFDINLDKTVTAYTPFSVKDNVKTKLKPNNTYILSAMAFSNGNSMRSFNSDSLDYNYKEFKNTISKNNTYIVLKLDTFKTEKEAENF